MEDWEMRLVELRELSEKLIRAERARQQLKIIGKTISLKHQIDVTERKMKLPDCTAGNIARHMRLLTELRVLYRTDEPNSPLNVIKREAELVAELYSGLIKVYRDILSELS